VFGGGIDIPSSSSLMNAIGFGIFVISEVVIMALLSLMIGIIGGGVSGLGSSSV